MASDTSVDPSSVTASLLSGNFSCPGPRVRVCVYVCVCVRSRCACGCILPVHRVGFVASSNFFVPSVVYRTRCIVLYLSNPWRLRFLQFSYS